MLTKQERAEIAERLKDCPEADYYDFYEAVTGAETTIDTLLDEDADKIADVILDLCDTSNMIELPLDKDGKVINIGDKVCDGVWSSSCCNKHGIYTLWKRAYFWI